MYLKRKILLYARLTLGWCGIPSVRASGIWDLLREWRFSFCLCSLHRDQDVWSMWFRSFASSGQLNSSKVNGCVMWFLLFVFLAKTFSVYTCITQIHLFCMVLSGYYMPDIVLSARNKVVSKTKPLLSMCSVLVGWDKKVCSLGTLFFCM